ncbi:C1q domain-containing protein [Fictibacillus enclensis]|nr:C1q domain-containing protein [Fictibacillus enclensis]
MRKRYRNCRCCHCRESSSSSSSSYESKCPCLESSTLQAESSLPRFESSPHFESSTPNVKLSSCHHKKSSFHYSESSSCDCQKSHHVMHESSSCPESSHHSESSSYCPDPKSSSSRSSSSSSSRRSSSSSRRSSSSSSSSPQQESSSSSSSPQPPMDLCRIPGPIVDFLPVPIGFSYFLAESTTRQVIAPNVVTPVDYTNVIYNRMNEYNAFGSQFTATRAGVYKFCAQTKVRGTTAATRGNVTLGLMVNNSVVTSLSVAGLQGTACVDANGCATSLNLSAGDVVRVVVFSTTNQSIIIESGYFEGARTS